MNGIFKTKLAPKEGHNYLRDYEITWLAKVFDYYGQQGPFTIRLDGFLCLWVRFYSSRMMSDILVAPDFFQKIGFIEKDGAMVVLTSKLCPMIEKYDGVGTAYLQPLEEYRIGNGS